ncbi:MAG: hypothetical protein NNA18_01815 [Nitrospira sp.]|nr:hypothetical protein [Nitrospira sp.]
MRVIHRWPVWVAWVGGISTLVVFNLDLSAAAPFQKNHGPAEKAAIQTVLAYATAISQGDHATFGRLDFSCQYRQLTESQRSAPLSDASFYEQCWQEMVRSHAHLLKRTDRGMDVLWPSTGPLVFYGDDLPDLPASAFVMDVIGLSPPGSGLRLTPLTIRRIPNGSFRLQSDGPVLSVPATVVEMVIHYQDPLTSPVAYAPGTARWTNTVKRARGAVKSITTQWVMFSGLKTYGFAEDRAVVLYPLPQRHNSTRLSPEIVPFVTEKSRALPSSLVWWGPQDQPGVLIAAAARAASFPELRDRVALLNRILIIDPNHVEALTILSKHLYTALLQQAVERHRVIVPTPALARLLNEFYWNIYSAAGRVELASTMEMGDVTEPTPADLLYRMLPAMETLARLHPELLDNRFRLGVAYRWNNDQLPMIQTFEVLVQDIPDHHRSLKVKALLQLAWSRINKVAWNRILHDPDSVRAYADAESALALADLPIDKFFAEYTMAYCMIFMPNYGDKAKLLHHLTEAKRWFDQITDKTEQDDVVWHYFLHTELLQAVLAADPIFKPIMTASGEEQG